MIKNIFPRNISIRGRIGSVLFVLIILTVSWYYGYHNILTYKPQSIHKWRQSDCASIALNYYQNGMNFFQPEVHNLASDNRTSGYAVGECPLLYYFIAVLYKIFGQNDLIYRLINTLIFFVGLFALYKMLEKWLEDTFWSIAVPVLLFTSPVVVYYANNYLTDSTSFAFVLMGWYFFFNYYRIRKYKQLILSLLLFTIAGLLKITSAINVIAIICLLLLSSRRWSGLNQQSDRLKISLKSGTPFVIYFAVIIAWYLFAINYNRNHQTEFFSTQIWPIWELSKETLLWIKDQMWTKDQMNVNWIRDYFHITLHIFILICFIGIMVFWKKIHPILRTLTLLLFTGVILFILLWFYAFGNHDYYIIGLLVLPLFILLSFTDLLKRKFPHIFNSPVIKICFALFLLFNISYAGKRLDWRYSGWINDYPVNKDLYEITPYLRSLGITPEDKVISLPDPTPCYSLYLMNQRGWTEHYQHNTDSLKIQQSITLGARYLILTGEDVKQRPYLQSYIKKKSGEYNDISIYSLFDN